MKIDNKTLVVGGAAVAVAAFFLLRRKKDMPVEELVAEAVETSSAAPAAGGGGGLVIPVAPPAPPSPAQAASTASAAESSSRILDMATGKVVPRMALTPAQLQTIRRRNFAFAARIPAKAQEALRTVAKGAASGLSADAVRSGLVNRSKAAERELDAALAK